MYKLMIADDNPYILQELCEITDWENFDFDLIGTFRNGKELLHAASEDMPELVITDISMPGMDGLQLSSRLYQMNPNIKIIFISEHSEFEYAKKALNLHVFDYVLKPIQLPQLIEVMEKVLEQLQKEQRQFFEQKKHLSQQIFFQKSSLFHYVARLFFHADDEKHIRKEFSQLGVALSEASRVCVACYKLKTDSNVPNPSHSSHYIRSLMDTEFKEAQLIPALIEQDTGAFLILMHAKGFSTSNLLSRLCIDIESEINCSVTMGYSTVSEHLSDLPELYLQAQTVLNHLTQTTSDIPVASYSAIPVKAELETTTDKNSPPTDTYSQSVLTMRTFIQENYMNPITTHDVAHIAYLSPSYANLCFSNECDITIFGFMVQCRIEKAKQLLTETDEHVSRIAELVGYSGKTSFYLAFKKNVGISPTEYRQQYSHLHN